VVDFIIGINKEDGTIGVDIVVVTAVVMVAVMEVDTVVVMEVAMDLMVMVDTMVEGMVEITAHQVEEEEEVDSSRIKEVC